MNNENPDNEQRPHLNSGVHSSPRMRKKDTASVYIPSPMLSAIAKSPQKPTNPSAASVNIHRAISLLITNKPNKQTNISLTLKNRIIMKKLFSFLCLLMLGMSIGHGQINKLSQHIYNEQSNRNRAALKLKSQEVQPKKNGKAPSAVQGTIDIVYKNDYTISSGWDEEKIHWLQFKKSDDEWLILQFCLLSKTNKENMRAYNDIDEAPKPGVYQFSVPDATSCYKWWDLITENTMLVYQDNSDYCGWYDNWDQYPYPTQWKHNGTIDQYYWNNSGYVTIAEGKGGNIYVVVTETSNDTYLTDDKYNFTIGEPKPYYNVSVTNNPNDIIATISGTGSIIEGGSTTLEISNIPEGFHFERWEDGENISTETSYTISNIQTNHNVTAVFEANSTPQYTITVHAENDNYCTVNGGGTYYKDSKHNISAFTKDEHLYFFEKWQKLNGENYEDFEGNDVNPLNVTVTSDATYRVVYRVASNGTITANASPAAGGSVIVNQPSTAGGTAVTLTVLENEGYTFIGWADGGNDSHRTVYVDGTETYVAQFFEHIPIIDEEGVFEIGTTHEGYFTIRGDGNGYHAELNYNATIIEGLHTYTYAQLDNSTDWSWIKPEGGNKIAIINAETTIDYYGLNYRAAALHSIVTCADGSIYDVTIYTNRGTECGGFIEKNTMGFRDDGYGGWELGDAPAISPVYFSEPDQQLAGEMGGLLLKWKSYRGSPYYETINIALNFILEPGASSIPSGRYPINGTKKIGTVFIGGMNSTQFLSSYAEYDVNLTGQARYNNWVYRSGYVDVINKGDGTYYIDCKGLSDAGTTLYFISGTEPTIPTYSITFKNDDGTQIGDVQNLEEGEYPTAPTEPTKDATTEYTYSFAGWKSSLNDNVYASSALPAVGTEAVIYTATYTSQAKAFVLKDGYTEEDKNNGNDDNFYNRLASMAGQPIESITYERTFKPKTWSVFALPFNYVLAESGHAFEGDVYGLTSVEYDAANNYLSLFFFPETTILYANRPYLYYSSTGVTNPVFQNVTMTELTTNYYSVTNNGTYGGKVSFRNTMYKQRLDNDSHIVFINNNTLYYMGTNNVYMRAFRGYFYMDGFNINTGVAPRVRIVLNGQTATKLEMVNDMPAAENGVRKYMENGTLVIEREGAKYNATGSKIN